MTRSARQKVTYSRLESNFVERERNWDALLRDMRRYLRNLLNRASLTESGEHGIVYTGRFPWGRRPGQKFHEINRAIHEALPSGWSVTTVEELDDNCPGWLFVRSPST